MKMNISSKETHQRVHFYRFSQKELERLALEKIAVELNFSIAQIYRIHGAALLDFIKENPDILKDDSKGECAS